MTKQERRKLCINEIRHHVIMVAQELAAENKLTLELSDRLDAVLILCDGVEANQANAETEVTA